MDERRFPRWPGEQRLEEESWGRFILRLTATIVGILILTLMGAIAIEGWGPVIGWLTQ